MKRFALILTTLAAFTFGAFGDGTAPVQYRTGSGALHKPSNFFTANSNAIVAVVGGTPAPAAAGLPTGGTSGQLLIKSSSTNYHSAWGAPLSLTINNTNTPGANTILLNGQSLGTNQFVMWPDGSVSHGYRTFSTWGRPFGEFGIVSPLLSLQDTSLGDVDGQQIYMVTKNGSAASTSFDVLTDTSSTFVAAISSASGGGAGLARLKAESGGQSETRVTSALGATSASILAIAPAGGAPTLTMSDHNGSGLVITPGAAASATPYTLGTTIAHTSGDLLGVANKGTNKFSVSFDGKISTADPGSGSGAWQLGSVITGATVTLVTTNYVEVKIGASVVKLAIVQ